MEITLVIKCYLYSNSYKKEQDRWLSVICEVVCSLNIWLANKQTNGLDYKFQHYWWSAQGRQILFMLRQAWFLWKSFSLRITHVMSNVTATTRWCYYFPSGITGEMDYHFLDTFTSFWHVNASTYVWVIFVFLLSLIFLFSGEAKLWWRKSQVWIAA